MLAKFNFTLQARKDQLFPEQKTEYQLHNWAGVRRFLTWALVEVTAVQAFLKLAIFAETIKRRSAFNPLEKTPKRVLRVKR